MLIHRASSTHSVSIKHLLISDKVIDNFERFEAGRNQGNDYKHYALQLSMAKLAYQRWLASVRIAGPANKSVPADLPVATEQETQAVKELLGAVQAAFTKAEKYTVHEEPQPVIAGGPGADDNLDQLAVSFKESAKKYQKSTNFVGRFRWVLHDSKALQTLTERVSLIRYPQYFIASFEIGVGGTERGHVGQDVSSNGEKGPARTCGSRRCGYRSFR